MTPPRRPRGEKAAVTIRYLRRQIANADIHNAHLLDRLEIDQKIAAEGAAELNQAKEEIERLREDAADYKLSSDIAHSHLRTLEMRHHFLEGYYAARQEALTGKTHRGAGSGDTPTFQNGRPPAARPWPEAAAAGPAQQARGEIRREPAGRYAPPDRRSLGEIEVDEVRDGTAPFHIPRDGR